MKDDIRLNFDFPRSDYPALKMLLAMKGITLKEFATELFMKAIKEAEGEMVQQITEERLAALPEGELIPWNEAFRLKN